MRVVVHDRRVRSSRHVLKQETVLLNIRKKNDCAESKVLEQGPPKVVESLPMEIFKLTLL